MKKRLLSYIALAGFAFGTLGFTMSSHAFETIKGLSVTTTDAATGSTVNTLTFNSQHATNSDSLHVYLSDGGTVYKATISSDDFMMSRDGSSVTITAPISVYNSGSATLKGTTSGSTR